MNRLGATIVQESLRKNKDTRYITIISKAKADKILSRNVGKLTWGRWDMGKYAHSGIGEVALVTDDIEYIYLVRRKDVDGIYYATYCITKL